ncbi:MAG: phosphoribosylaminoimidazolesuccinocarboxamide synthase [Actinomycetota bacterium]|nr:phosphoribosylaminoimidazolesuccinocarboxamide synthase [Actinomycetota bacterium]
MPPTALTEIDLPLPRYASGKVREVFELGEDRLLVASTDRISAYDVVMSEGIPDKGSILTGMTEFWLDFAKDICPHHLLSTSVADLPEEAREAAAPLRSRLMIVRRLQMMPVEFIVRGYLAGSGWADYRKTGSMFGMELPKGMRESDKLPEPVFTPTTKATVGHDESVSEEQAAELAGFDRMKIAKDYAISLYKKASEHAAERGIILADTKFEFGVWEGEVYLGDEVLTPDSSRFWPADQWEPGRPAPSFDKQYLRDWLDAQGWDRKPPPPPLPAEVIEGTRVRYLEAYERLTGRSW